MELSTITLDREPLYVLKTLQSAGFEAYIVGGAVRDILVTMRQTHHAGKNPDIPLSTATAPPKDYDFTTNATPKEILELFPEAFYENNFGTVMITPEDLRAQFNLPKPKFVTVTEKEGAQRLIDLEEAGKIHESLEVPDETAFIKQSQIDTQNYEITTYRSEGAYTDHRRPAEVVWGETLKDDLERRDFTINALALEINPETVNQIINKISNTTQPSEEYIDLEPEEYTIIDPHNGLQDLATGTIDTVGQAQERFKEDALRMLRAIRFSVQLNMQIEDETYEAIITHHQLLEHISWERISAEFLKMLSSDFPKEAIEILDDTGILKHILPELIKAKGVEQGGHHTTDVWTHSLDALAECPSSDPVVRLATLLHDIAKPQTYRETNGDITFYNHEVVGARIAKKVARRLKLSKKNQERIFTLVRHHMFYYQPENSDASIRRFMRRVGLENIDDILALREGDRLGSGARRTSWRLEEMKERIIEQLNQPMEIKDLAIDGHDLMNEFDLEPGPKIGEVLNNLFEQVLENPDLNTKEQLLEISKETLSHD